MTKLIDGNIFIDKDEADRSMNILGDRLREVRSQCDKLQAENERLNRMLLDLTPGGSEFHGSPQKCYDFIVDSTAHFGKVAAERNHLRDENERLRAALEAMYKQNKYNDCNCAKCRDALALTEQALEATE